MLIREMLPADVEAVYVMEREYFSEPWSKSAFLESLDREDTIFLVCEDILSEGEAPVITAYLGMYVSFNEGNIVNVAVKEDLRKKGYGHAVISKTKELAKAKNIDTIFLEVRVSNQGAISLYKKNGFEELGIRKNFYDFPKEDALIMSCKV